MAETKRRLPPWMLKQKTETKVQSSDANLKPEEKCEDLIKEKHVKRQQRKRTLEEKNDQYEEEPVKRKQRRKTLNQDPDEFEEVEGALHKCQTRRRNSRGRRKHEMEIGEEKEGSKDGVKNKRAQKRRSVISDDETDLTVDDLVSIAEEYVNADKHKQEQRASATTTENGPAKNASKPLLGPSITKGLLKCSTNTPSPDFSDCAIGENPTNVAKSGDPAQEMLDLFLGPLLRKPPPVKEPAVESVDEVCSISLVKTCDHAVYREGNAVEETETLVKKKSSLKDKVSMFLS